MLICIMGNSGAGKDTIIKNVLVHARLRGININQLLLITDRPRRIGETGQLGEYVPYKFVTPEYFTSMRDDKHEFIEHRAYAVNQPGQEYFNYGTCKFDFENAIESDDIYITTCVPSQFYSYYWYCKSINMQYKLYPVFLNVSDKERLLRSINRIDDYDINGIREVCRRFYSDTEYINPLLVPCRFCLANNEHDIDETTNFIVDLMDTFIGNDWSNDFWVTESANPSIFGGLLM